MCLSQGVYLDGAEAEVQQQAKVDALEISWIMLIDKGERTSRSDDHSPRMLSLRC